MFYKDLFFIFFIVVSSCALCERKNIERRGRGERERETPRTWQTMNVSDSCGISVCGQKFAIVIDLDLVVK